MHNILENLINKQDLSSEAMQNLMNDMMTGNTTDAQIASILTALRMKGETITEITAAVKVMRTLSTAVQVDENTKLVDTCGTGGDGSNTFNISTACAFVVATAGGKVAKHGNRSISSKSGSADVLEAAGVNLNLTAEQVGQCVDEIGVGFMFAPMHHSAMKHVIQARKQMAVRTIFNMLGPLTNPAGALQQVIGVYDKSLTRLFADVLKELGAKHVMVVHAEQGLDEISISGKTFVSELKNGKITDWIINPADYKMERQNIDALSVNSAKESLEMIQQIFANKEGPAKDIVCLNAGAALYVSGIATTFEQGVALANITIASLKVQQTFDNFIQKTKTFS